jgi:hypothetical protein
MEHAVSELRPRGFAPPSQVSEVALRLDRLGRIDAKTNQCFLRRLFSRYARDVLDIISVHHYSPIALAAAE